MVRSHGGRQKQNVTSYIAIHGAAAKGPVFERPSDFDHADSRYARCHKTERIEPGRILVSRFRLIMRCACSASFFG